MQISAELKKLGFGKADRVIQPRIIMSISALEKQGKTHFGCSAPGRIGMYSLDVGTEGVIHKFDQDKIIVNEIEVPEDANHAIKIWDKYFASYYGALNSRELRTILVDTATEAWELLRIAKFGKLAQVPPFMYGPVNAIYRKMIKDAYKSNKNLVLLHKMKPKYVNDKRTADYERAGFSDTGFNVQVNAEMWRDEDPGDFHLEVIDCRQNPDLVGMTLDGESCTFPILASLVIEGTSPEDWE